MHRTNKSDESPEKSSNESDAKASSRSLCGFRATTIFDITQTDGEPLSISAPQPLTGDAYAPLLAALIPICNIPVTFGDCGDAYGAWSPITQTITIHAHIDPNHQIKTFLHEWAHAIGVRTPEAPDFHHRGLEEIIAETTANVLSTLCGLDTTAYSEAYIRSWAQGDPKRAQGAAQDILSRVHHQIQAISAHLDDPIIAQAFPSLVPIKVPTPSSSVA